MPKWRRRTRKQCMPIAQGDGTSLVPLTQGMWATIDTADESVVSQFGWFAAEQAKPRVFYARGKRFGKSTEVHYLHRLILGEPDSIIDHLDGDGLNCCRSNLRLANYSQNGGNIRRVRAASGFKGVYPDRSPVKPWRAAIEHRGCKRQIGTYRTSIEAAAAYDAVALELHGPFAATNARLGLLPASHQEAAS